MIQEFGNQYSFIIFGFVMLVALFGVLRWRRASWGVTIVAVVIASSLLTVANFALRPGESDVSTIAEADALLTNGQPTLIEFFSNYCTGCILARPAVDALVGEIRAGYGESFNVLRVNIHTDVGMELRERYGFTSSPEFVLLDQAGAEVWRSSVPPERALIDQVAVNAAPAA